LLCINDVEPVNSYPQIVSRPGVERPGIAKQADARISIGPRSRNQIGEWGRAVMEYSLTVWRTPVRECKAVLYQLTVVHV
jgi:hypothetical protein